MKKFLKITNSESLSIYFIMKKVLGKIKSFFMFVSLDYSFILIFILALFLESYRAYFLYVVFIILHELCHLFVAKRLGYLPKKLKLTFFGASLEGFDDFLLADEIKIVLAGPLFNLFAIIVCYLSFWFYPESYEFLNDVLMVNKSILLFNILPIFPLDAGRFLLCLFSIKDGRGSALKIVKVISFIFVGVLFFVSLFVFFFNLNLTLGFVAINLCVLIFESTKGTSFKREILLEKKLKRLGKGLRQKVIYVKRSTKYHSLLKFIDGDNYFVFIFVDDNFIETGRLDEKTLLETLGFI